MAAMKVLVVVLLAFGSLASAAYTYCQAPLPNPSVNTEGKTLRFVHVLTRHGDRTPTQMIPGDNGLWLCRLTSLDLPNSDSLSSIMPSPRLYRKVYMQGREELNGNCSIGQLTDKGLEQHLALGAAYRKLYGSTGYGVLPDEYDPTTVYVRSTDVPRTVASAQGNVWTLFPPGHQDGQTALIDINTMDNALENMVPQTSDCPRLDEINKEIVNSTQYQQFTASLAPLYAQLQQIFNVSVVPPWEALWDNMGARMCHGMPLPPGITDDIMAQIKVASDFYDNVFWNNPEAITLMMGDLLAEILQALEDSMTGASKYTYRYYSGHDSTVGPLAASLGITDNLWPPYASHMELEIWQDASQQYYVQVKYNGNSTVVPTCPDEMCPWKTFSTFATTRTYSNRQQACAATRPPHSSDAAPAAAFPRESRRR